MYINYSGLNIGGKSYFNTPVHPHVAHRDNRGRNVAYEHTEFTSGKEIRQAASNAGISLQLSLTRRTFFRFADYRTDEVNKLSGTPSAKKIQHQPLGQLPLGAGLRQPQQDLLALHVRPLQKGLWRHH